MFKDKNCQSFSVRHRLSKLWIFPSGNSEGKKRIPYCMPHLFFLGTVFILWQMNELGDFEMLLYKMWHWNQQHFDVTSIWTSENFSGSWNGGVLKNGITDGQPCSESGNSPSTSNISNSQKSECYISIPNIQHTSKNQHDTNIWHVTLLPWYCISNRYG